MPNKNHKSSSGRSFGTGFSPGRKWSFSCESPGLLLTDLLIAALLLIFPFVMGGREALGHKLVISLSLALGCVWSLYRFRTGGRLVFLTVEPLILAGLLLLWFQTVPNSAETLNRLSSEYSRLLSGWGATQVPALTTVGDGVETASVAAPVWNTASLTPVETRHGMLMFVAYAIIAVVVAQRIMSEQDCGRILKLVAASGVVMAAFAVLQLATSNDLFFWFYRHPYTGTRDILKGAFTNRNHFAQFLALSIGPLTWWMIQERRIHNDQAGSPSRKGVGPAQGSHSEFGTLINVKLLMLICATSLVMLSVLLSLSRGGMLAAGCAFVVVLLGLWKLSSIRSSLTVLIMGLGFAVIGGLFVVGQDKVEARVDQLASGDADKMDQSQGRRTIWKADAAAIKGFPLLGTGVGSHREVYPIYMTDLADFATHEFTHAESTYMQVALETGLLGAGLLAVGLLLITGRIIRTLFSRIDVSRGEYLAAVLASLTAGLLHAVADFIWYVPAIVVTTIVLGVVGLRLTTGFSQPRSIAIPRVGWLLSAVACGIALLMVQPDLARRTAGERFHHQYLIATLDEIQNANSTFDEPEDDPWLIENNILEDSQRTASVVGKSSSEQPDTSDYRIRDADTGWNEQLHSAQRRMQLLIRSLRENPRQPRVQMHLAALSLNLFDTMQQKSDNPLNLAQIGDVVASSGFASADEMHEWLHRAFGSTIRLPLMADKLARQSLKNCPIQGAAYLTLAETAFLRAPQLAGQAPFVDQALLVRGYDPKVRFFAGARSLLTGDQAAALEHWAMVFRSNSTFRREITRRLSTAPASFLLTQFQPDTRQLADVLDVYVGLNRSSDVAEIIAAIEKAVVAESDTLPTEKRVEALMQAYRAAYKMQLPDRGEWLLKQAMACDETAYWPRRNYGLLLYETERYAEAGEVLLWCYQHEPGDANLDRLIRESRRRSLRQDVSILPAGYQTH